MTKEQWDNFFEQGGVNIHTDPVRFSKIAELCKGSVLDVGCGTGDLASFFMGEYTGFDISPVAIGMARDARRTDANFSVDDILTIGRPFNKFYDTVVLGEFIEHFSDTKAVIAKILPLLAPHGRLIISVPNFNKIPDADHVKIFTVPQIRKDFAELGKVLFHPYPGFSERIIFTVDTGAYNEKRLALAMIAKNEGQGLEACVISTLGIVDEVVISIDTASTDNTKEVAEQYADKVLAHKWENSFCKARNSVQSHVSCPWVLSLDGHERVTQTGHLEDALKKDTDAIFVQLFWETGFHFYFPRIIKKEVQWIKDVHNFPAFKTEVELPDFVIVHDREKMQSEKRQQKSGTNNATKWCAL